jgi:hypothetical protein
MPGDGVGARKSRRRYGMVINGVDVENARLLTESEILDCIRRAEAEADAPIARIRLTKLKDGSIRVDYITFARKFERIRRITGYLVGTIDRWNNAKQSEEHERVKHV